MKSSKEKVSRLVSEKNLTSHMNNTKWSVLLPSLKEHASQIDVKCLLASEPNGWTSQYLIPTPSYFEPLPMGPIPFREIEWVIINPIDINKSKEYLLSIKIPHTIESNYLKVWGYSERAVNFV